MNRLILPLLLALLVTAAAQSAHTAVTAHSLGGALQGLAACLPAGSARSLAEDALQSLSDGNASAAYRLTVQLAEALLANHTAPGSLRGCSATDLLEVLLAAAKAEPELQEQLAKDGARLLAEQLLGNTLCLIHSLGLNVPVTVSEKANGGLVEVLLSVGAGGNSSELRLTVGPIAGAAAYSLYVAGPGGGSPSLAPRLLQMAEPGEEMLAATLLAAVLGEPPLRALYTPQLYIELLSEGKLAEAASANMLAPAASSAPPLLAEALPPPPAALASTRGDPASAYASIAVAAALWGAPAGLRATLASYNPLRGGVGLGLWAAAYHVWGGGEELARLLGNATPACILASRLLADHGDTSPDLILVETAVFYCAAEKGNISLASLAVAALTPFSGRLAVPSPLPLPPAEANTSLREIEAYIESLVEELGPVYPPVNATLASVACPVAASAATGGNLSVPVLEALKEVCGAEDPVALAVASARLRGSITAANMYVPSPPAAAALSLLASIRYLGGRPIVDLTLADRLYASLTESPEAETGATQHPVNAIASTPLDPAELKKLAELIPRSHPVLAQLASLLEAEAEALERGDWGTALEAAQSLAPLIATLPDSALSRLNESLPPAGYRLLAEAASLNEEGGRLTVDNATMAQLLAVIRARLGQGPAESAGALPLDPGRLLGLAQRLLSSGDPRLEGIGKLLSQEASVLRADDADAVADAAAELRRALIEVARESPEALRSVPRDSLEELAKAASISMTQGGGLVVDSEKARALTGIIAAREATGAQQGGGLEAVSLDLLRDRLRRLASLLEEKAAKLASWGRVAEANQLAAASSELEKAARGEKPILDAVADALSRVTLVEKSTGINTGLTRELLQGTADALREAAASIEKSRLPEWEKAEALRSISEALQAIQSGDLGAAAEKLQHLRSMASVSQELDRILNLQLPGGEGGLERLAEALSKVAEGRGLQDSLASLVDKLTRASQDVDVSKLLETVKSASMDASVSSAQTEGAQNNGPVTFPPLSPPATAPLPALPAAGVGGLGLPLAGAGLAGAGTAGLPILLGILAVLALLVMALRGRDIHLLAAARRIRREAERAAKRLAQGRGVSETEIDEVVGLFARLLELYGRLYRPKARSETHREYGRVLPSSEEPIYMPAAAVYEEAKFSPRRPSASRIAQLAEAVKALAGRITGEERGEQG